MKYYLDSKDLIAILQGKASRSAQEFREYLFAGDHKLVVSCYTIIEISAPLLHPHSTDNVMSLLNELEKMPIVYMHADSPGLELKEALNAFANNREYLPVVPFVKRFDETLDLSANPPTSNFLNYPLAEIVWDLYRQGELKGMEDFANTMRALIERDRNTIRPPSMKSHFAIVLEKELRGDGLSCKEMMSFTNWVYENPNRCPGIRLSFEVWRQIVMNKTDGLEDSDMEDYQHIICLPYVDAITLDRRMHSYVSQARTRIGLDTRCMFRSIEELWRKEV
ncbi:hypothetical protein [Nitrospira sp. BLG_1]|uniref:hypothetical protein n=1 Tax=Nitrospira sp. BLG_1 TaxID=3395883 RepID=UPI0039BD4965